MVHWLKQLRLNILFSFKTNTRWSPKCRPLLHTSIPGLVFTAGFGTSCVALQNSIVAEVTHFDTIDEHFHLLETLRDLAPKIDAPTMLYEFLDQLRSSVGSRDPLFSADFVRQLFVETGIEDPELIQHLFDIVDWNRDGMMSKYEVAALFTLFNVGTDLERYKFLFNCLDLGQSGHVNKDSFRHILTCLLEAKYHIYGLENDRDPDEIYRDITPDEYHTMAKFAANQLVRKIFIFADQKKRGYLIEREFLHWCMRGGKDVRVLKELLYQAHDESSASEIVRKYKVGVMEHRAGGKLLGH